ncbi:hypothetical protein [Clostridium oryzae]|uniref:Uncharacterized protein n=1 Tax=Clostridium oryzae TaxID=1450648 RepID=A0A1V4IWC0_9CLOT|nr:hypothetical protein [Clostridium oryzae]OPJ64189.1 hypothetical protein CLORY_07540 [Clostridium oryzae]
MINLTIGLICQSHKPLEGNYCYYLKELCYQLSGNNYQNQCRYMCEEEYEVMQSFYKKEEILVFSELKNNDSNSDESIINFNDEVSWNIAGESYDEIMKLVQGLYRIPSFNISGVEFIIKSIELNRVYDDVKSNSKVFTA